jgi:hypothetical protein
MWQQPAQQAPQQFQQPAQQPPPQAPQQPQTGWYMPDEQMVEKGYNRAAEIAAEAARARAGGGGDMKFVRMPGPQGQPKWDATVPIGWEARVAIYLAPAWALGQNYYIEGISHFWKSYQHPAGTSVGCPGKEICLIDKSRGSLFNSGRESDAQRARQTLRGQKHFYYQGFLLDLGPQQHVSPTGVMRPFILDAGSDLHAKIQFIMKNRGYRNVLDKDGGRPLIVVKRKTGPDIQNVDWDAIDGNPMPLPMEYRNAQLWDLAKLVVPATPQEQVTALIETGMPIPPEAYSMFPPGSLPQQAAPSGQPSMPMGNQGWNPGPGAPPFPSPYGAPPAQTWQQPVPQAPPQNWQQPAPQAAPPSFGPPQPPPMPVPPQTMIQPAPQPPAMGPPPPTMPPPPPQMAPPPPPPVSVPTAGAPNTYQPQPSQAGAYQAPTAMPPPPPMGMPPPPPPMAPPPGRPQ